MQVIVKKYISKCEIDEEDPFTFEGPELIATVGYVLQQAGVIAQPVKDGTVCRNVLHVVLLFCRAKINWKKDKNVTVKTVRMTQKNKSMSLLSSNIGHVRMYVGRYRQVCTF